MPRPRRPASYRSNKDTPEVGDVPAGDLEDQSELPKPKRSWLAGTKASWARYWSSPARHLVIASLDLDGLERLWDRYDELERAHRELRKARIVTGSQGQDRVSGFYAVISRLDAEIRQLEDRVGKSMKSRLALGMRVGGDRSVDEPDEPDERPEHDTGESPPDRSLYLVDRQAG